MAEVMSLFAAAIAAVVNWFDILIEATGFGPVIIAGVSISLVVALLIVPIRGGAMSGISSYTKNTISGGKKRTSSNNKSSQ